MARRACGLIAVEVAALVAAAGVALAALPWTEDELAEVDGAWRALGDLARVAWGLVKV